MKRYELESEVESLIDKTSLRRVLEAIATVAILKAQHIEDNWQDSYLSRQWQRAGQHVDKVSARIRREGDV